MAMVGSGANPSVVTFSLRGGLPMWGQPSSTANAAGQVWSYLERWRGWTHPSHHASGAKGIWGRNSTRWDDDVRVPMAFKRGITPRGDGLGSDLTVIQALGS